MDKYLKYHHPELQKLKVERLQKFYLAIEGTSDQITITDRDGIIIYANKATKFLSGYSAKEIIGKKPDLWAKNIIFNCKSYNCFYGDMFKTVREKNCCFFGEVKNQHKTGKIYFTNVRITSIRDYQNGKQFFVITERDITPMKQLNQTKLEFISMTSHELRTPLASISLASELLIRGADKNGINQKFLLEEIYINTQKMAHLISTLMDLARIEMGTLTINPEAIDIVASLNKILNEMEVQIKNKNISVKNVFDQNVPAIMFDKKIFLVIFDNLISNAIKYTPNEGNITLKVKKFQDKIEIHTIDTGIGIDKKDQAHIFYKQFRAENALKSKNEGNGLGLYIVKSLIEKTNAKISVQSEINKGSTFKVIFPTSLN
ncbi:MAG: PAS domain-containing sensor histidine kinase [Candidatus Buchananbacteria bacterium]